MVDLTVLRRIALTLLLPVLLVLVAPPAAPAAPAAVAAPAAPAAVAKVPPDGGGGPCAPDVSNWTVVRWFESSRSGPVPLRCGQWDGGRGWGYRKAVAKARWNPWYRDMMGAVLGAPTSMRVEGTTHLYFSSWFTYCDPEYRFKIVVQTRTFGHRHMKGIITAFEEVKT